MASGDNLTSMNDIFKETYEDLIQDIMFDKDNANYSTMTVSTLEYRVNRYSDEGAKKELKKRKTPLYKVLNE